MVLIVVASAWGWNQIGMNAPPDLSAKIRGFVFMTLFWYCYAAVAAGLVLKLAAWVLKRVRGTR